MEKKSACELRIYVSENAQKDGLALYEALVLKAREFGLGGATLYRSPMGFGSDHEIHTAKILRLNSDLPMVVEMVDAKDKIESFLESVSECLKDALVTLKDVEIRNY
jgi:hypothetical protein